MKVMVKSKNRGTHLEELLAEDGRLQESTNRAIKSVLAWQLAQAMKKRKLTKQKMAAEMKTSRAQLDRILDPKKGNVTIETLQRAAKIVGRELRVELV
jgi:antitoxin HicB